MDDFDQQQSEEPTFVNMEEGDTIQLAEKEEEGTIERYRVKRVLIGERRTPIILQNLNGPCPLIAVFNIISLRGGDVSALDNFVVNGFVTNENLVQLLAQSMLDTYNNKYSTSDTDGEKGKMLQAALDSVPKLKNGLDVNVLFTEGVTGFTTCDLSVFNFFNLKLMHGWLVDSESELETFKALKGLSYDQAVEKIVLMNELVNAEEQMKKSGKVIEPIISDDRIELKELKTPEEMVTKLPLEQKDEIISHGSLIQNFLTVASSQLTEYGLNSIHNSLAEKKIAIFFRNNHFSVICKIQNSILTLCTNETLLNETNIVWENLTIHGENQHYYLGDFTPFRMLETHSQNYEYHNQENQTSHPNAKQDDEDLQLALQLQREEEMAYQQMIHEQQQHQQQQPQHNNVTENRQPQPVVNPPQPEQNARISPRLAQTPLEQDPSIPYANLPTIREKKGPNTNGKKHGANAYANQASQLRELNKERRDREINSPPVTSQNSKKSNKKESDCIIC